MLTKTDRHAESTSERDAVRVWLDAALLGAVITLVVAPPAKAIPLYAQRHATTCTACHSIPPKLNQGGLAFKANGYRLPPGIESQRSDASVPFSTWITGRFEDRANPGPSDSFLPKVELIAGGPIGEKVSYFVEWRIVSQSLRGDGTFQDRGGRFEDLFLEWSVAERQTLTVGQFRSLNQVDVSRRLSPSEPLLFRNGLPTGSSDDPDRRIASLSRFSPSSRSPGIGYTFQSMTGERASDGLFHHVILPFTGELSIPLGAEARDEASFELTGPAKGIFLETYYRRGLDSFGVHVFYDDESWLATGLTSLNFGRDFYVTAGLGVDDREGASTRDRYSVELEYVGTHRDRWRLGGGIRLEDVSDDGREEALVPYFVLSGPQSQYNFLLQLQYRDQEDNEAFVLDLSAMF